MPLENTSFDVVAYFYAPGKFDVNKWKLNLKLDLAIEMGSKVPPSICILQLPVLPQYVSVN